MIVTAWNNGDWNKSGAGYGIRINRADRDMFFSRQWRSIALTFDGSSVKAKVNVAKKSFWGPSCRELIKKEIGQWLQANNLAAWPENSPPNLWLEKRLSGEFFLRRMKSTDRGEAG
jgi:hypothetical protein